MTSQPIIRRKLSDEIRERLLGMIRSGELHPGDRLPSERELMAKYGVGRPAIREAMQSLQNVGLIEISHGERAKVAQLSTRNMLNQLGDSALHLLQTSPESVVQLREARLMFEVGMVRLAAQKATKEDISRLRESLVEQQEKLDDIPAFIRADMAFHSTIASISGNPFIEALSAAMLDWLFNYQREILRAPSAERLSLSEHKRIAEHIEKRDPDGAAKAMRDHLARSDVRYRALAEESAISKSVLDEEQTPPDHSRLA
jgi:DNA-binding FadR family transcriptional regulator